jgi:hypothetical protein
LDRRTNSKLPLYVSDQREIRDFAERNVTGNFQGLLSLFYRHMKALFADIDVLIVDLDHAFVSGRGDLLADF